MNISVACAKNKMQFTGVRIVTHTYAQTVLVNIWEICQKLSIL